MEAATEHTALLKDETPTDDNVSPRGREAQLARRLVTVEPVLFLYMVVHVAHTPLIQQYVYNRTGEQYGVNWWNATRFDSPCDVNTSSRDYLVQQDMQRDVSKWLFYFILAQFLPAAVTSLPVNVWSDSAGRKPAIVLPLVGSLLYATCNVIVVHFRLPIPFFFIGFVLDGLGGSYATAVQSCTSYIADVTPEASRSFRMVVLDSMIGLGTIAANLGLGFWIKAQGYFYPFIFKLAIQLFNILYVLLAVPETVDRSRSRNSEGRTLKLTGLKELNTVVKTSGNRELFAFLMFIFSLCALNDQVPTMIYQMNAPLCWGPVKMGYYQAEEAGVALVGGLVLVKLLSYCLTDRHIVIFGSISATAILLVKAFATTDLVMFLAPAVGFAALTVVPIVKSLLSKQVPSHVHGSLFALLAVLNSLFIVGGTALYNELYAATLNFYVTFVFLLAAGISGLVLLLLVAVSCILGGRDQGSLSGYSPINE